MGPPPDMSGFGDEGSGSRGSPILQKGGSFQGDALQGHRDGAELEGYSDAPSSRSDPQVNSSLRPRLLPPEKGATRTSMVSTKLWTLEAHPGWEAPQLRGD